MVVIDVKSRYLYLAAEPADLISPCGHRMAAHIVRMLAAQLLEAVQSHASDEHSMILSGLLGEDPGIPATIGGSYGWAHAAILYAPRGV